MSIGGRLGILSTALAVAFAADAACALERAGEARVIDADAPWDAASTCAVTYENHCTGWQWAWNVYDGETFGVVFDPCCSGATLDATSMQFASSSGSWGFSGIITVSTVSESGCAQSPLASRAVYHTGGLLLQNWGIDCDGPVLVTFQAADSDYGIDMFTDHPGAGPTGPPACGYCYPTTRVTHSFYYGTTSSPICPGSPIHDGTCNVEIRWAASFSCTSAAPGTTWATIKALYR